MPHGCRGQAESFQLCFKALNECQGGWVGGQFASPNPVSDPISESWLARSAPGALSGWSPEDRNPTVFWLALPSVLYSIFRDRLFLFLTTEAEVGLSSL